MSNESKKGIWDFAYKYPFYFVFLTVALAGSTLYVINGHSIESEYVSISPKHQEENNEKTKECSDFKEKAKELKDDLDLESKSTSDEDLRLNLVYWKNEMDRIINTDCSIYLQNKTRLKEKIIRARKVRDTHQY